MEIKIKGDRIKVVTLHHGGENRRIELTDDERDRILDIVNEAIKRYEIHEHHELMHGNMWEEG